MGQYGAKRDAGVCEQHVTTGMVRGETLGYVTRDMIL